MSRRNRIPEETHVQLQPTESPTTAPDAATRTHVPVVSALLHMTGDLAIAPDAHVQTSLHVEGHARIGRGAQVQDALFAGGDIEVGDDAHLAAVETHGQLRWGHGAEATRVATHGPVTLSDGRVCATSLLARRGIHAGAAPRERR